MEINENLWATKPVISPHVRLLSRGSLWTVRYVASSSEICFLMTPLSHAAQSWWLVECAEAIVES